VLAAILSFGIGKWVSTIGAIARVALLAFFTFSVVLYAARHGVHGVHLGDFSPSYDGFIALVPLLFFNYVGFELPSSAGDEMVDARRDVPFAVIRSAVTAILAYAIPIFAILFVLPQSRITGLKGFVDTMQTVFTVYGGSVQLGEGGASIVVLDGAGKVLGNVAALGFIWALVTSGTTWIMGADRTQAVACLDGGGPRRLGALSSRFGTPVPVNLASGVVATVIMIAAFAVSGDNADKYFTASLGVGISTTTISYLTIFPALYRLRRLRPDVPRPYRVPGGDHGAFFLSALTTGWALVATLSLLWPGFGTRGDWDAALPAPFVTLDAEGRVLASQRVLFELSQLVPLVIVLGVGLLFYAVGCVEGRPAVETPPRRARRKGDPSSPLEAAAGEVGISIAPSSV
jgi:amino acid transporter